MIAKKESRGYKHGKKSIKGLDRRVYLSNLDPVWSEEEIKSALSTFGKVVQISVYKSGYRQSKTYGFANFSTPEEASASYGQLHFRNRIIEVKSSIQEKYRDDISEIQATNYRFSLQKQNIEELLDKMPIALKVDTQDHCIKSKPAKLSKNSKDFEKAHPTNTDDQTTIDSDSGKITINIIKITSNSIDRLHQCSSNTLSYPSSPVPKKSMQDRPLISKYSKEFHPAQSASYCSATVRPALTSNSRQYLPMLNPFTDFKDQSCTEGSDIKLGEVAFGEQQKPSKKEFKITFFAFPGRF